MPIKLVECLAWSAPNKPGELLRYAEHFKKERVDLDGLWAYTSRANESKIAAIGKKPAKLRAALEKMWVKPDTWQCFYVTGKDRAGALVEVLRTLGSEGINVECADAMAAQGRFAAAVWVSEKNLHWAKKALKVR